MSAGNLKPRRIIRPIDSGPIIPDLAAAPRAATRLNVNKNTANLALLPQFAGVQVLAAREVPPAIMEASLTAMPLLAELDIYGTRMASLAPLATLPLTRLRLVWAHQLTEITPLAACDRLAVLSIGDMKRMHDFSPLARCRGLKALHIESGMWSNQKVTSLAFLGDMPQLEELSFNPLTVPDDNLGPIGTMKGLRFLDLPGTYPLREYARLSVCLPETVCERFGSHITYEVASRIDPESECGFAFEEHVILVGKPATSFARSDPKCASAIARREALMERWRTHYRMVPDPAKDTCKALD